MGKELRMGCNRRIGKCENNCIETGEEMKTPNSTELLEMAHREWKNRQERKGLNDEAAWVSGWMHGYLTKRDW
jgi:hypothetical protein